MADEISSVFDSTEVTNEGPAEDGVSNCVVTETE